MKKLIFLLLMAVALVGLVSASTGAAHPPGAPALEMALSGYGVDYAAVTPDTVLAEPITIVLPASFVVVPLISDDSGDQTQRYALIKSLDTGQGVVFIPPSETGFYMLC